jgi:septum formation protein
MPEIFDWFDVAMGDSEIGTWTRHEMKLVQHLRERFQVAILRTRNYTHEIVITPDRVDGPNALDYIALPPDKKTGYGDVRTASQVHSFLSPRIVLASRSPQRRELLRQIVTPSKIQVISPDSPEEIRPNEPPEERVKRVAREKAEWVLATGEFHDDIELIIGADTEIVRRDNYGRWKLIGHPATAARAYRDLKQLNNGAHYALTGLAVIGRDPKSPKRLKTHVVCEKTTVTFIDASEEQLRAYADTREPIGRAGAYAIQGLGAMLIRSLDGSYSNVVGLPLERLSQVLADEFDKPIWRFDKVSNWCFPDALKGLR